MVYNINILIKKGSDWFMPKTKVQTMPNKIQNFTTIPKKVKDKMDIVGGENLDWEVSEDGKRASFEIDKKGE